MYIKNKYRIHGDYTCIKINLLQVSDVDTKELTTNVAFIQEKLKLCGSNNKYDDDVIPISIQLWVDAYRMRINSKISKGI